MNLEVIRNSLSSTDSHEFLLNSYFQYCKAIEYIKYTEFKGIRITPKNVIFSGAYNGKHFEQIITIQNVTKKNIVFRIEKPTSMAFKMIGQVGTINLAPGLSIKEKIKYTCCIQDPVLQTYVPIYVDIYQYMYKIKVYLAKPIIRTEPKILDFGVMNIGQNIKRRDLYVYNDGDQTTSFTIEINILDIDILIEPCQGILEAKSKLKLECHLVCAPLGYHLHEFWIKCEPVPIRVQAEMYMIQNTLQIDHINATRDVTVIDFPFTLYGCNRRDSIILKNASATPTTFIILCEHDQVLYEIENKGAINENCPDLKNFSLSFTSGTLEPFEGRILTIFFHPKRAKLPKVGWKSNYEEKDFIAFLKIINIEDKKYIKYDQKSFHFLKQNSLPSEKFRSSFKVPSENKNDDVTAIYDRISESSIFEVTLPSETIFTPLRLCLHGDAGSVVIKLQPDAIHLGSISKPDPIYRVVCLTNLTNCSSVLLSYRKCPCVFVEPAKFSLNVNESREVSLKLIPKMIGKFDVKVGFDVTAQENADGDGMVSVGYCALDLNYEILSVMYQKKTSGCKLKIMYDKFSKEPRYVAPPDPEYTTTTTKLQLKANMKNYYNRFIRRERNLFRNKRYTDDFSDSLGSSCLDMIDQQIKLKSIDCRSSFPVPVTTIPLPTSTACIPLTPWQLYNIRVEPKIFRFEKVSIDLATEQYLTISNENSFAIKVILKSKCKEVTFLTNFVIHLNAHESKFTPLRFLSEKRGRFHRPISYIINDCHHFELNIFANVVKKQLRLIEKSISFEIDDANAVDQNLFRSATIVNDVNAYTSFLWRLPENYYYQVYPETGIVPPRRTMLCQIYRKPEFPCKPQIDLFFVPEEGHEETVQIFFKIPEPKVVLTETQVNVGIIPLNLTFVRTTFIQNKTNIAVSFLVLNPEPISCVSVTPIKGTIYPKSVEKLTLTFKIPAVIQFEFQVNIKVQEHYAIHLPVIGETCLPIISVNPKTIKFRRLSADSFDRVAFTIKNEGKTRVKIKIGLPTKEYSLSKDPDIMVSLFNDMEELNLLPNQLKLLYIHFYPEDVASYEFYLPIIINDIVGPSTLEDSDTLNPLRFIEEYQTKYFEENGFKPSATSPIPNQLQTLKITVVVPNHILQISNRQVEFYFSNMPNGKNCTHQKVTIKNLSKSPVNFLIRTDFLNSTAFEAIVGGEGVEQTDLAIIQNMLPPNEHLTINLTFKRIKVGLQTFKLPLFLQNYDMGNIYNFITLNGTCAEPKFSINVKTIYFAPVPLNILSEREILVKFEQYATTNNLNVRTSKSAITVKFPEGNVLLNKDDSPMYLPITVCFQSDCPISFVDNIVFEDDEGKNFKVMVCASAENCQLTVYKFLMAYRECYKIRTLENNFTKYPEDFANLGPTLELFEGYLTNYSSVNIFDDSPPEIPCIDFPKYPNSCDNTEIKQYLDSIVYFVETVMYREFFQFRYHIPIPDGFLASVAPPTETDTRKLRIKELKKKRTNPYCDISQLLEMVFGQAAATNFEQKSMPETKHERVGHIYKIVVQLVNFISAQGGCVGHIEPIYLMDYDNYLVLLNEILPFMNSDVPLMEFEEVTLDRNDYQQLSKRMWLDMALQICKIVKLSQVTATSLETSRPLEFNSPNEGDSLEKVNVNNSVTSNIYSTAERTLLIWLNLHYKKHYQSAMFDKYGDYPSMRIITNFTTDLNDALPFIFVTASYCPFLINECFHDLYGRVTTREKALHNATRLIEAWTLLKLGYICTYPKDIVDANPILMLLVTVNIYFSLPHYLCKDTLYFSAPLSKTFVKEIQISNKELSYYKIFVRNDKENNFSVDPNEIVTVTPKKPKKILVTYHSKRLRQVTAVLIVYGEIVAGHFSHPVLYTLVGQPQPLPFQTITVSVPLYESRDVSLKINVPYQEDCKYDIFCTNTTPETSEVGKLINSLWSPQSERKIPREFTIFNETLTFQNDNPAILSGFISKMLRSPNTTYVIFSNKIVGDFIVKIEILPSNLNKKLTYTFEVKECCHQQCICKASYHTKFARCSCVVNVPIPKRDEFSSKSFRDGFMKTIKKPEEQEYWLKMLETCLGYRLLQWLSVDEGDGLNTSISTLFKNKDTYKVSIDNKKLLLPSEITIDNTGDNDTYDLPVITHTPGNYTVKLISLDQMKERCYVIQFVESNNSSRSSFSEIIE